jgi:hypothetical protein
MELGRFSDVAFLFDRVGVGYRAFGANGGAHSCGHAKNARLEAAQLLGRLWCPLGSRSNDQCERSFAAFTPCNLGRLATAARTFSRDESGGGIDSFHDRNYAVDGPQLCRF